MKILTLITRGDSIGGAQTHVLSLSKLLIKNNHELLIVIGGEKGPFTELLDAENIQYFLLKKLKRQISIINDIVSIFEFSRIVKSYNPDLITLHSTKAGLIGRLSKLLTQKPIIFTAHGWAFTTGVSKYKSFFYKMIERWFAPLANAIIVVSDFDKNLALQHSISTPNKFYTIHNGIPISFDVVNKSNVQKKATLDLVMIARFDNQKDHKTLLDACKDIPDIMIHLLGDGPNYEKTVQYINDIEMNHKVKLWGYTKEVNKALQLADVFLLISNWEGFPISTLEAMNFNLPVIISDVGGAKEAVIENYNGYSVPQGNVNILKSKINSIIHDPNLRIQMGKRSKEILVKNFTEEVMYFKTFNVYQKVLEK